MFTTNLCRSEIYNLVAQWLLKLVVMFYLIYFVLKLMDINITALLPVCSMMLILSPIASFMRDRYGNEEEEIIKRLKGQE